MPTVVVCWLGHASFRLADENTVVYIDPWQIEDEPHDANVVFVSHDHYDHFSPEDIEKVSGESTTLVAPREVVVKLGSPSGAMTPGDQVPVGDVLIEAVAAYNVGKAFHPKSKQWLGAVVTLAGRRIYYAGDTDLIPEMSELADVDLALLPVGGTYTLSAEEAAEATRRLAPAAAIGYHWGEIVGGRDDAETFREKARCPVHLIEPGQAVRI
jgi:L-ascorbate metabolism protein UlaG (beta-lactamase superfamily)